MEKKVKVCYTFDRVRLLNALILARGALCIRAEEYDLEVRRQIQPDFDVLRDLSRALLEMDSYSSIEFTSGGEK